MEVSVKTTLSRHSKKLRTGRLMLRLLASELSLASKLDMTVEGHEGRSTRLIEVARRAAPKTLYNASCSGHF